jgi:hypothetical protein
MNLGLLRTRCGERPVEPDRAAIGQAMTGNNGCCQDVARRAADLRRCLRRAKSDTYLNKINK